MAASLTGVSASAAIGKQIDQVVRLRYDFAQSLPVSLQDWQSRPLWRRVKQRIWGWVDRQVVNILGRRH